MTTITHNKKMFTVKFICNQMQVQGHIIYKRTEPLKTDRRQTCNTRQTDVQYNIRMVENE